MPLTLTISHNFNVFTTKMFTIFLNFFEKEHIMLCLMFGIHFKPSLPQKSAHTTFMALINNQKSEIYVSNSVVYSGQHWIPGKFKANKPRNMFKAKRKQKSNTKKLEENNAQTTK